ncbi:MAG: 5-guanidino-2-oxopentanoate decarboxylase [Pseudomonadota bacterium]
MKKDTALTVGESLVHLLEQYGIETVFGIPGTHSIELYRGLASSRIRHVNPRHEQGAGFMADGYARTVGKPAACFVITGPGVTNLSTAIGEAYMDSAPMLIVSPVNEPVNDGINHGRLHEITNQEAVTRPLCALSMTATKQSDIPDFVHQAFELFATQNPRPVHLHIPLGLIRQTATDQWKAKPVPQAAEATESQLNQTAALIDEADRPVLIVGGGASHASTEVQALADRAGIIVLTTVAGRGIVTGENRLGVGAQLRAPYVQDILTSADLIVFAGTEFGQTDHWNDDLALTHNQVWINLDADCPARSDRSILLQADARKVLAGLIGKAGQNPTRKAELEALCESARKHHAKDMSRKERRHWDALVSIQNALPANVIVTSDMTQIAYTAVDYLPLSSPRSWHHPTGYGTLGYGLPAAIGAALSSPDRPVVCIVGDAGLQYTLPEMGLATELNLNITILLWNNDALQQIRDDMDNAQIDPIGVSQKNPDFSALAMAYHWDYRNISDSSQITPEIAAAIQSDGPTLVELHETVVSN